MYFVPVCCDVNIHLSQRNQVFGFHTRICRLNTLFAPFEIRMSWTLVSSEHWALTWAIPHRLLTMTTLWGLFYAFNAFVDVDHFWYKSLKIISVIHVILLSTSCVLVCAIIQMIHFDWFEIPNNEQSYDITAYNLKQFIVHAKVPSPFPLRIPNSSCE